MVPDMLQSACRVDVTNFPFDQQKCRLVFTPWTHNQKELDLVIEEKEVLTKHYVESSEWSVIDVKTKVHIHFLKQILCMNFITMKLTWAPSDIHGNL